MVVLWDVTAPRFERRPAQMRSTTLFDGHRSWFWSLAIIASLALHAVSIGMILSPGLLLRLLANAVGDYSPAAIDSTPPAVDERANQSGDLAPVMESESQSAPSSAHSRSASRQRHASNPKPRIVGQSQTVTIWKSSRSPSNVAPAAEEPAPGEPLIPPPPPSGSSTQIDEHEPVTDQVAGPTPHWLMPPPLPFYVVWKPLPHLVWRPLPPAPPPPLPRMP